MKKYLLITAMVFGTSAFADLSYSFDVLSESFCPEKEISKDAETISCKASNAKAVKEAKIGDELTSKDYKRLGFTNSYAVDIGLVPDADSNTAYFYTRWLLNEDGKKVGVITIEGWFNEEMEDSARFYIRYNLKGEAVVIYSTALN